MLFQRVIKLCKLIIYTVLIATWHSRFYKTYMNRIEVLTSLSFWLKGYFLLFLLKFLVVKPLFFLRFLTRQFFNKGFILNKDLALDCQHGCALSPLFTGVVALAWFCERMGTNIKIERFTSEVWCYFENDTLNFRNEPSTNLNFSHKFALEHHLYHWGIYCISPEYGYKILSKLSIKEELKEYANQWLIENIRGDWVAVHYRGSDVQSWRHRNLENYIIYLQAILDNQCNIFACSDQAQFIDQMYEAFPNRVSARNIQRSYDAQALHRSCKYKGTQQVKDALIDVLILAKAKLIYTTGSGFVDIVQFFNPKIKIISLYGRTPFQRKNYMPIPHSDLLNRLSLLS